MKIKLITWALLAIIFGCLAKLSFAANLEKLVKETEPKVVKIGIVTDKGHGVCSGSFISSTGIVLTCAHCFSEDGIRKVFIKTADEKVYPAALLAIDEGKDLALIVPDSTGPFPYFNFGKEPQRGQQVLSFGSPLGVQHTITVGWVDNVIKQAQIILHSAFVNPGNSGGPLVDTSGKLVGVNEAMLRMDIFELAHGLYLAIDIIKVKQFLQEASHR